MDRIIIPTTSPTTYLPGPPTPPTPPCLTLTLTSTPRNQAATTHEPRQHSLQSLHHDTTPHIPPHNFWWDDLAHNRPSPTSTRPRLLDPWKAGREYTHAQLKPCRSRGTQQQQHHRHLPSPPSRYLFEIQPCRAEIWLSASTLHLAFDTEHRPLTGHRGYRLSNALSKGTIDTYLPTLLLEPPCSPIWRARVPVRRYIYGPEACGRSLRAPKSEPVSRPCLASFISLQNTHAHFLYSLDRPNASSSL